MRHLQPHRKSRNMQAECRRLTHPQAQEANTVAARQACVGLPLHRLYQQRSSVPPMELRCARAKSANTRTRNQITTMFAHLDSADSCCMRCPAAVNVYVGIKGANVRGTPQGNRNKLYRTSTNRSFEMHRERQGSHRMGRHATSHVQARPRKRATRKPITSIRNHNQNFVVPNVSRQ